MRSAGDESSISSMHEKPLRKSSGTSNPFSMPSWERRLPRKERVRLTPCNSAAGSLSSAMTKFASYLRDEKVAVQPAAAIAREAPSRASRAPKCRVEVVDALEAGDPRRLRHLVPREFHLDCTAPRVDGTDARPHST